LSGRFPTKSLFQLIAAVVVTCAYNEHRNCQSFIAAYEADPAKTFLPADQARRERYARCKR
jgi:hypothetical protein